jgi:hypothetical protein
MLRDIAQELIALAVLALVWWAGLTWLAVLTTSPDPTPGYVQLLK